MKKKKIGRNDPCPCGSGKKYKKCCIDKPPVSTFPDYIPSKKRFIEEKTGNKVTIEERNDIVVDAITDFGDWKDMSNLPKIFHKTNIDTVHILHELIHLEKFFVDQYSVIVHNKQGLSKVDKVFKNIPEDYLAHKIIKYEYDLNPIKKTWFRNKGNLNLPDEQIAANLVNFYAYCEFCPEYKNQFDSFCKNCRKDKAAAFLMADRAIKVLENMDYKDKNSYNQCADKIIEIFAPHYYPKNIYLSCLSKSPSGWRWNP